MAHGHDSDPTVFNGATHRRNSRNGNPTYVLHTDAGDYTTETDGSIGYSIGNYTGGPDSLIGKRVILSFTPGGRVWNMRAAEDN